MIHYLSAGLILGLSAGLAPGPLLALVVSETVRHDIRAGIRVAMAPLVTDLPIVVLTVFLLSRLSDFNRILGLISLTGGAVVFFMGIQSLRSKGVVLDVSAVRQRSLAKGILVNMLSPHPYLFWLSVGAPMLSRAWQVHAGAAVFFVSSFYAILIGSKIGMAVLAGRSKHILKQSGYVYTMRFLGLLLCLLSLFLFRDGLRLLGLLKA